VSALPRSSVELDGPDGWALESTESTPPMARSSHRRSGLAQEQLKDLRDRTSFTKPRKPRLSGAVVHRRVMTVRGAYKIAHKRSLGLGGRGPSEGSAR
jgi:hypothetical protein